MPRTTQNRKPSPRKNAPNYDNIKPVKPSLTKQNRKLPALRPLKPRKPNAYNVFFKENKEVLSYMTKSEISLAYRQTLGSDNWPYYEPINMRSVDSDEDPVEDPADRFRLDELASFGTARQVSNTAFKNKKAKMNNSDSGDSDAGDDAGIDTEYDIENMSPQTLLSLAPYIGIWDKLSEAQIQSIVDTKSGLTLNGEAIMSSYKGRNSYRTPRKPKLVLLPSGERFYI